MDDRFIVGVDPSRRRTLTGKHSVTRKDLGALSVWSCSKCFWQYQAFATDMGDAEYAAFLHITAPELLIAGSSDVELEARRARVNKPGRFAT